MRGHMKNNCEVEVHCFLFGFPAVAVIQLARLEHLFLPSAIHACASNFNTTRWELLALYICNVTFSSRPRYTLQCHSLLWSLPRSNNRNEMRKRRLGRFRKYPLVHLDGRVDLTCEPKRRRDADGAGQQTQSARDHRHVAKVQHRADEVAHIQTRPEVVRRVQEHVKAAGARDKERTPPPAQRKTTRK